MRSMTGYGRARVGADGREISVELKSVNHRFLDIGLRMPKGLLFLEDSVRKQLAERLHRGHVDVFVSYHNLREDARTIDVDIALLRAYTASLDLIAEQTGATDDRTLTHLAELPDVLRVTEADDDQAAVRALCLKALGEALSALEDMREREGTQLLFDLQTKINKLSDFVLSIKTRAPRVKEEYALRLKTRIAELLDDIPVDPQRLAQEVALMADRAAIDEELVRLHSHLDQMQKTMQMEGSIGRKLDFLVQECNREINTIGAKASDLAIAEQVVEAKAEMEKIREQVQNIE